MEWNRNRGSVGESSINVRRNKYICRANFGKFCLYEKEGGFCCIQLTILCIKGQEISELNLFFNVVLQEASITHKAYNIIDLRTNWYGKQICQLLSFTVLIYLSSASATSMQFEEDREQVCMNWTNHRLVGEFKINVFTGLTCDKKICYQV